MPAVTPSPPGERNLALDGLRGIAIGLVVIEHYYVQVGIVSDWHGHTWLKHLLGFSYSGVELFFVLSGYLIGSIVLSRQHVPNLAAVFYGRRLCRTLPTYLLLLLAFLAARTVGALNTAATTRQFTGTIPWWGYASMTQNLLMAALRNTGPWWLVATWSLAVEEQFYLSMPWLVRVAQPRAWVWLAGVALVSGLLLRHAFLLDALNPFAALYLLPSRMDSLLLGVALAAIQREPKWWRQVTACRRGIGWGVVVFALAFVTLPFGPAGTPEAIMLYMPTFLGLGFAVVLLYVLLAPESGFCRGLRHPALMFLGGISYFIYLFHLPVLYTLHSLTRHDSPLHSQLLDWLTTALSLLVVLVAGAISRRWLELPFIEFGRRLRYRETPPP